MCVDDRLRGGAATCRDGDDGDVVVVDDVNQSCGVCKVDAVGGGAFGCLARAGVGVNLVAAGVVSEVLPCGFPRDGFIVSIRNQVLQGNY